MSDNWDQLTGFDDWSRKLDELLDASVDAIRTDSINGRVDVQKRLREFRINSPNEFSRRLDEIAGEAILDIFRATLEESLQAISARSDELQQYLRDLRAVTDTNRRAASFINLESPAAIATSLTDAMAAVKGALGL